MQTLHKMIVFKTILLFFAICSFVLQPATSFAIRAGDKIIPFTAKALDGKTIDINQLLSKGPVMLVFWASWCSNCARELPLINELVQTPTGKKLQVVSINVGYNDSIPKIERFIKKHGMNYPVVYDQKSLLTTEHKVPGVPTIFIANKNGTIVFVQHFVPNEEILKEILH